MFRWKKSKVPGVHVPDLAHGTGGYWRPFAAPLTPQRPLSPGLGSSVAQSYARSQTGRGVGVGGWAVPRFLGAPSKVRAFQSHGWSRDPWFREPPPTWFSENHAQLVEEHPLPVWSMPVARFHGPLPGCLGHHSFQ